MVSFVLIISFLLHIITFAAIYQLLKQIQTIKQENAEDIQGVLDTYLQEIRNENIRLQRAVQKDEASNQEAQPLQKNEEPYAITTATKTAGKQIEENDQKDYVEASLHSRILQMHAEGVSESEIARKLNCGKTEAALIIKLYG